MGAWYSLFIRHPFGGDVQGAAGYKDLTSPRSVRLKENKCSGLVDMRCALALSQSARAWIFVAKYGHVV